MATTHANSHQAYSNMFGNPLHLSYLLMDLVSNIMASSMQIISLKLCNNTMNY